MPRKKSTRRASWPRQSYAKRYTPKSVALRLDADLRAAFNGEPVSPEYEDFFRQQCKTNRGTLLRLYTANLGRKHKIKSGTHKSMIRKISGNTEKVFDHHAWVLDHFKKTIHFDISKDISAPPSGVTRYSIRDLPDDYVLSETELAYLTDHSFYECAEWLELRFKAIRLFGKKCRCCGVEAEPPHVDHIKPRSKHPVLALALRNVQILCRLCNVGKSNIDETDFRTPQDLEILAEELKRMEEANNVANKETA